jgi:hypothetical protein
MANVQILAVGRALVQGARGARGGAPSKDSVWGLAQIDNSLVKFFGRTGGALRYKTEPLSAKAAALDTFQTKLTVPFKTNGGEPAVYSDVTATAEQVVPGLAETVRKGFYKARSAGKVNTRSTAAAKKAKLMALKTATKAKKAATVPAQGAEQASAQV